MIAPSSPLPKSHILHFNIGRDRQSTTYKWGDNEKMTKNIHKAYSVIKQQISYPCQIRKIGEKHILLYQWQTNKEVTTYKVKNI